MIKNILLLTALAFGLSGTAGFAFLLATTMNFWFLIPLLSFSVLVLDATDSL